MAVDKMRDEFYIADTPEPHAIRKKQILAKHPEIEELFGYDNRPIPFVLALIASQLVLAYYSSQMTGLQFFFIAWIYGGASSHALSLMTHEISHNLVFEKREYNEYFGILCNVAMGLPSSTTFKRYHMEHHQFQGHDGVDVDIPTEWEGRTFRSAPMKVLFLLLQFAFYAIRPMIVRPKTMNKMDMINFAVIVCTDALIFKVCGMSGLMYILLSSILGMGLHPVAGHFLAEHMVFDEGHETYSYYGSLNWLCWNVGYHNEHHDFPRVPGWRLPEVKRIAPEFYDNIPVHKSWTWVLVRFIIDDTICPFNRLVRKKKE